MKRPPAIRGRMLSVAAPEWEPLADLAPDHVDDFMWMFSVELKGGVRLQAYKHYWTRRYMFLDLEGRAYVYEESGRYREVDPYWLLWRVLDEDLASREDRYIVGHNVEEEEAPEIHWARSATRHRISRESSQYVIEHCGLRFREGPLRRLDDLLPGEDRILFLGDDEEGVALEVIAVEVNYKALLVIHAMELRDRNRGRYREAERWRR